MSSLAAAKADNFYFPPEFDPAKHKSLNKVLGRLGDVWFGATHSHLDSAAQRVGHAAAVPVTAVPWISPAARARGED